MMIFFCKVFFIYKIYFVDYCMDIMLDKYEQFLKELDIELSNYFSKQSQYIYCKEGCCYCCLQGQYPMSTIEFEYLKKAFKLLSQNTKNIVITRIKKLKKEYEKQNNKQNDFEHACPFLIGKSCCIYQNRPIICRTFGLIKSAKLKDGTDVALLPECLHKGLNYSNVFDFLKNDFDDKKIKDICKGSEPMTYDISLQSLYEKNKDIIEFGIKKVMIEFLKEL